MNNNVDEHYALHTDLYQINMAETYWDDNIHNKRAIFELYFRELPFGNGYAIFAGLEKIIDYLESFRFTDSDLEFLKEMGYQGDFLEYLRTVRFSGNVRAMNEGEVVFSNEPILRVDAPLSEAQLVETALLNIVNYQTLIATKASRIKEVAGNQPVAEFGTRRAHEFDAAIWGTRAAYIGGFSSTSNVRASKLFGIPASGTHAHSLVQAYKNEYTAFHKYAKRHKDCVFLVDTYDTLKLGVPTAIQVAKELGDKINFIGIRLDSGDLAYLSKMARKMLDDAGFVDAKIIASNDLDEYTIMNLKAQGAKIDSWGIGTKVITAFDQPALGAVYKMVAIENDQGEMIDKIKLSSNPEKVTTPGIKNVYRLINQDTQKAEGDYIALAEEQPEKATELNMIHPVGQRIKRPLTNCTIKDLHEDIFEDGRLVYERPSIHEIQSYAKEQLSLLWEEYRRSLNPERYPVNLSEVCYANKMKMISEAKAEINTY